MADDPPSRRSWRHKLVEFPVVSLAIYSLVIIFAVCSVFSLSVVEKSAPEWLSGGLLWNSERTFNHSIHDSSPSKNASSNHQKVDATGRDGSRNETIIPIKEPMAEKPEASEEVPGSPPLMNAELMRGRPEVREEVPGLSPETIIPHKGEPEEIGEVPKGIPGPKPLKKEVRESKRGKQEKCDTGKGKWVYDKSYPLYRANDCRIVDEGFNCLGNGRTDTEYMKWKWIPEGCTLTRFNATNMLNMIRGKRVVFAGDSLNRNQWESMLCLLIGAVKDPRKVYEARRRKIVKLQGDYVFKFAEYRCTVEFHVSHFLVREGKMRKKKKWVETLQIDRVDRRWLSWINADILIFNSAHWWTHSKTKSGINYFQEGRTLHRQLDVSEAFRRAMTTWASWVDQHVNPNKTRVFFRSAEPSHYSGGRWNSGGHCSGIIKPEKLVTTEDVVRSEFDQMSIVTEVTGGMKTPVTVLNITGLSDLRIDAHPSRYFHKINNSSSEDCSHWCLPGVPDTWNVLLYNHLLSNMYK